MPDHSLSNAQSSSAPGAAQAPQLAQASRPGGTDWTRTHLWEIQPVRDVLLLAAAFGVVYLGYVLRIVTVPMLLALALAYLFEPLVKFLVSRRVFSRAGAAAVVILAALVIVVVPVTLGAGYAVVKTAALASSVADSIAQVQASVTKPEDTKLRDQIDGKGWRAVRDFIVDERNGAGVAPPAAPSPAGPTPAGTSEQAGAEVPPASVALPAESPEEEELSAKERARSLTRQAIDWARANADEIGQAIGKRALGSGASAVTAALGVFASIGFLGFSAFLTAFFFFYFVTGWGRVQEFWQGLIPERRRGPTIELLAKMDRVIAGFVRGRLTIVGILMIYMTTAYALIGVPGWYILGPLVGSLFIVPFAHVIGVPTAMLLMWLEPGSMLFGFQQHWWWIVFAPIGVYMLAQLLDDYVLSPTIQGKNTDMDTPSILFASIAGGALAGIYGLLIAIPAAACIKILLKEVFWPRFRAWGQGRARDPLPLATSEKSGA